MVHDYGMVPYQRCLVMARYKDGIISYRCRAHQILPVKDKMTIKNHLFSIITTTTIVHVWHRNE